MLGAAESPRRLTIACQVDENAAGSAFYAASPFTTLFLNISPGSECYTSSAVFNTCNQRLWQLRGLISI